MSSSAFSSGAHLQGCCEASLKVLSESEGKLEIGLIKSGKPNGYLHIQTNVSKLYSFLDYLRSGCEISLMVAIDFTGSNGDPNDPKSLHYLSPHTLNDYELAIKHVGDILAEYDSDQLFPVWGFVIGICFICVF